MDISSFRSGPSDSRDMQFLYNTSDFRDIVVSPPPAYDIMNTTPAKNITDEYVVGTLGENKIGRMCKGLENVGLDCPLNTPEKMVGYTKQVLQEQAYGKFYLASPPDAPNRYEADFTIVTDPGRSFNKLKTMAAPAHIAALMDECPVAKHHCKNSMEKNTVGGIKDVLVAAGKTIGMISAGQSFVNPGEIGTVVGGMLSDLTTTTEDHLEEEFGDTLCIIEVAEDEPSVVKKFGIVSYTYSYSIKHFKDKKKEFHEAKYEMNQFAVTFSNSEAIHEIYEKVMGH